MKIITCKQFEVIIKKKKKLVSPDEMFQFKVEKLRRYKKIKFLFKAVAVALHNRNTEKRNN
jgi:hypothetical protein